MTEQKQQRDYWMKDNNIFVCDGYKYQIAPTGETVCTGPVTGAVSGQQEQASGVAKLATNGKVPPPEVLQQKNAGGRPRKEGQVSRSTEWRREKEKQGVLL